ncbi:MAG: thermostable hemolysin, partial [Gemmatimonadales bacterium]|nr:thermostable hemolysin [Gemmatimonadales bacterium]
MHLQSVGADHPERAVVEAFVRRIYEVRYGAEVRQFAPRLVALRDDVGEIVAAAGYRPAGTGPLFLECYLPAPVEALLGAESAQQPSRKRIVEVGHLAASRAGAGERLILLLGSHLAGRGFQWVVSTLTEELRQMFVRLGVAPLALGVADPAVLGAE